MTILLAWREEERRTKWKQIEIPACQVSRNLQTVPPLTDSITCHCNLLAAISTVLCLDGVEEQHDQIFPQMEACNWIRTSMFRFPRQPCHRTTSWKSSMEALYKLLRHFA
jgi:hypothetical protein